MSHIKFFLVRCVIMSQHNPLIYSHACKDQRVNREPSKMPPKSQTITCNRVDDVILSRRMLYYYERFMDGDGGLNLAESLCCFQWLNQNNSPILPPPI